MLILSAEKVYKVFQGVQALADVDCVVQKGKIHGLIGPNGSGKSTMFNVITGVYRVTSGKIFFEDRDISGMKPN
jgi:ABC-type branched-subunit amino acid transport system ATPase component